MFFIYFVFSYLSYTWILMIVCVCTSYMICIQYTIKERIIQSSTSSPGVHLYLFIYFFIMRGVLWTRVTRLFLHDLDRYDSVRTLVCLPCVFVVWSHFQGTGRTNFHAFDSRLAQQVFEDPSLFCMPFSLISIGR